MRIIFSFAILIISCQSNWGNYDGYKVEYNSAVDYFIVLDKGNEIFADYDIDERTKNGTKVTFKNSNNDKTEEIIGKGGIIIPSFIDVKRILFNKKFILIAQKPIDSICECNIDCLIKYKYNTNTMKTYEFCKKALIKSTLFKYWIIDKEQDIVYGPLSKLDLIKKNKELRTNLKYDAMLK